MLKGNFLILPSPYVFERRFFAMNSIFVRRSIREYDIRPVEPEKLD